VISGEPIICFGSGKAGFAVGRKSVGSRGGLQNFLIARSLGLFGQRDSVWFLHLLLDWVQKNS